MDAFVQIALIEKAKQVFASDPGSFLSFPLLSPVAFTAKEVAALSAPSTPADYAAAADFARIVNFIPRDLVAGGSGRMLWDVYLDVLSRAEVAQGPGATSGGVTTTSLLYETAPDGTRTESAQLKLYRQYRDAWFVLREDYAARRLTGEFSEDPDVRRMWTTVDEPRLRSALDALVAEWETLGRRTTIEAALKAEQTAALQSPKLRWGEWSAAFNPDIDMITEAGGIRYAPTGLSPRNFAEQDDWLEFELTASEMRALVDSAPERLRSLVGANSGSGISSVSFQYRSVAVVRPWFRPEALTSRIWRSNDVDLQLSDGADPPNGACPAYVAACVFVRDIAEVMSTPTGPSRGNVFDRFSLPIRPQDLVQRQLSIDPATIALVARRRPTDELVVPHAEPTSFRALHALKTDSFLTLRDQPSTESLTATSTRSVRRFHRHVLEGLNWTHVEGIGAPSDVPEPAPSSPSPKEELSVLAFICRKLPQTPNPAPFLEWDIHI